ncbi:hypothetical protein ONS96_002352 [Cadophora gregata f. sp. sojae]|nr:hypothetical protein ONS96_002352 [Cadophora gregata f. sp. sojae]
MMKSLQEGRKIPDISTPIPFPLPLRDKLSYVYTINLQSSTLTVSFHTHRQNSEDGQGVYLTVRTLSLDTINQASDMSIDALLQNGSNPLLDTFPEQGSLQADGEYDLWDIEVGQPTAMNELQHRMFTDFVYQWRFFLDDRTLWQYPSSTLFRRLCIAFLRLAAWDFEISSESEIADLPLRIKSFPAWDSPPTDIYWFHGFLVVICEGLGPSSSISAAVSRAREFLGDLEGRVDGVNCILMSLCDISFVQVSSDSTKCSTAFPLIRNSSATDCSPGFRILSYLLTSTDIKKSLATREVFNAVLPPEVFTMIFNKIAPSDIVACAQASFTIEKHYYSSLPQLPNIAIHHLGVSIPCCGSRNSGKGLFCSDCYTWRHLDCLDSSERSLEDNCYICPKCLLFRNKAGNSREKLIPGGIERLNHRSDRPEGCPVLIGKKKKVLQLRRAAPAAKRPEVRLMDPTFDSPHPNQIDYVIIFGGVWTGLAYGLDDVGLSRGSERCSYEIFQL